MDDDAYEYDGKVFWIKGHLWQHNKFFTPVPAEDALEAEKKFREAIAQMGESCEELVIEGISDDPEELMADEIALAQPPIDPSKLN